MCNINLTVQYNQLNLLDLQCNTVPTNNKKLWRKLETFIDWFRSLFEMDTKQS